MYSQERLHETFGTEGLPLMVALATPTHADVDALLSRADGLVYCPETQRNSGGHVTMHRHSTCSRRGSTGLVFTDNDRQQDD
jgi:hypothetical protein